MRPCIRVLPRNTTNRPVSILYRATSLSVYLKVYVKELVHVTMSAGKAIVSRAGGGLGTQARVGAAAQRLSAGRAPSLGVLSLLLVRPLTDWMRPAHIPESHLLYPKSTDLRLISSKNHLHSNTQTDI